MGVLGIRAAIAFDNDGFGTKLSGKFHGHGRVDTKCAGFIAARCDYSPVARTTYEHGFAVESTVVESLAGDEEGVEVDMYDGFMDGVYSLYSLCGFIILRI